MHAELMHELKRYFRGNVRSTNTMNQSHSENVTQPTCRKTGFKYFFLFFYSAIKFNHIHNALMLAIF